MSCARAWLAVAMFVTACNDDVDLEGIYAVTSYAASMPCGADGPAGGSPPFIKFVKSEFLGTPIYNYVECEDSAGTNCEDSGGIFDALTEPIDNGWLGHITSSSGTEASGSCFLRLTETRAILDGNHLVIEVQTNQEEIPFVDATCTTDEADRRGTDMPCIAHEQTRATKR